MFKFNVYIWFVHINIHIMFKMLLKQPFAGCFPVIKQSETPIFCFKTLFYNVISTKWKDVCLGYFYKWRQWLLLFFIHNVIMISALFHFILKPAIELYFWGREMHETACSHFLFILSWTLGNDVLHRTE